MKTLINEPTDAEARLGGLLTFPALLIDERFLFPPQIMVIKLEPPAARHGALYQAWSRPSAALRQLYLINRPLTTWLL